jgi:hypothetical protein
MMQRYLFPLALLAVLSCRQDPPAPAITTTIKLDELALPSDSVAVLHWSTLNNPDFESYTVVCKEDPTDPPPQFSVFTTTKPTDATCTHRWVPYTDYVQYQVIGRLTSGQTIESNIVTYQRPQIKTFDAPVFHVLFEDQSRRLLFFGSDGKVVQYDVASGQVRKSLDLGVATAYASFGTYQGVRELYVPCKDGRVLIFNAATLDPITEIVTGGGYLADVLALNNLLYVSSYYSTAISQLAVFDRATKRLVTQTGAVNFSGTRLYPVPAVPNSFIGVTLGLTPCDQALYQFSAAGRFLSKTPDKYHADYPLDPLLFEFLPGGNRYISGEQAGIYTRNMDYVASLDAGKSRFTSFGSDASRNLLYAGAVSRQVKVFSLSDYAPVRQFKTRVYPLKLFKDPAGGMLSVSTRYLVENYFYSPRYEQAAVYVDHVN